MIFAQPMPAIERWRIHARLDALIAGASDGHRRLGGSVSKYRQIDRLEIPVGNGVPWKESGRAP